MPVLSARVDRPVVLFCIGTKVLPSGAASAELLVVSLIRKNRHRTNFFCRFRRHCNTMFPRDE